MTDPRKALSRARQQYDAAEAKQQEARGALVDALIEALRGGVSPTEAVELSGFSAAYVRTLAREHGIPPAPLGGPGKPRPHRTPN